MYTAPLAKPQFCCNRQKHQTKHQKMMSNYNKTIMRGKYYYYIQTEKMTEGDG